MSEITLSQLLQQKKINQKTYDRAIIGKQYIERKYNLKAKKNKEWNNILLKINELNIPEEEKEMIKHNIYSQEIEKFRKARKKQSIENYESITIIGRGAFGEVHVCRDKTTDEIVAIKKIKKEALSSKNQIIHIKNEQLFMANVKSPWIVELKASFQDHDYLYLVMEFLQGGDLMNILIKKDILTEEEARFYIAEIILAVESIHKLDCIHRDIKPDNVLIDKNGHIKLTDFGLAKISDKIFNYKIDENKSNNLKIESENGKPTHNKNYSCVGTAYYVAPEVLNKKGYGPEIDWWSVGVIFYEMLVGYVPFCSKDTSEACYKVLYWKKYVTIPSHVRISKEAEDLIFKLINSSKNRLGKNGAKEIKDHPFFYGFNWDNIQNIKPPFIPFLRNEYDTSYFETFEKKEPFYPSRNKSYQRKNIEYLDYSFMNDSLNHINLNDEYEKAIKIMDENRKKNKKNSSCDKNKKIKINIKKRSNGGNMGFIKIISSFQNEKKNNSNSSTSRKNIGQNNKNIPKINIKINNNNKNNSIGYGILLNNYLTSRISKNKINIIKLGQKKMKNINNKKKESLNKIKIPKGIKKNKRNFSPIYKITNSHKSKNNINIKEDANNNIINIYSRNYCSNNNSRSNNGYYYNTIDSKIQTKGFYNKKDIKLNGGLNNNNKNNNNINFLYNNYIKGKNILNSQLNKSYRLSRENKTFKNSAENKTFRLSPNSHNHEFYKKFLFNKIIISHNKNKSPISYASSSKTTHNKEFIKKKIIINSNTSFNERNGAINIKKQNKINNIFRKNI